MKKVKQAILLSSCDSNTYRLFKRLAAPTELTNTFYEDIKHLISGLKNLRANLIAKHIKSISTYHADSKTISKYNVKLWRSTQYCHYKTALNDILQDRLAFGVIIVINSVRESPEHCNIHQGCC